MPIDLSLLELGVTRACTWASERPSRHVDQDLPRDPRDAQDTVEPLHGAVKDLHALLPCSNRTHMRCENLLLWGPSCLFSRQSIVRLQRHNRGALRPRQIALLQLVEKLPISSTQLPSHNYSSRREDLFKWTFPSKTSPPSWYFPIILEDNFCLTVDKCVNQLSSVTKEEYLSNEKGSPLMSLLLREDN